MDGRHTPQSRRATPDREVGPIHRSPQMTTSSSVNISIIGFVVMAFISGNTRCFSSVSHFYSLQVSHKQMTQLILFSLLHQKQPARAIYDFKAQTAK